MSIDLIVRPDAQNDIEEISDYLFFEAGLRLAERFVTRVQEAIELLREQPSAGARARLPLHHNVRIWGVTGFPNHLVFYRATGLAIEVLHVAHSARRRDLLFDPPAT